MSVLVLDRESHEARASRRRWAICFAIVVGMHALPAVVAAWWLGPVTSVAAPPPAAVMVDMAPLPAEPQATPTKIPPGPQQTLATAPPESQPDPFPDAPAARKPAVVAPRHAKPRIVPRRQIAQRQEAPPVDRPPATATTAPPASPALSSTVPTAPAPQASSASPSNAMPTWQGLVLGRLEAFKRYPALAQYRRQQGVAYLRFTMDRSGRVLTARIEKTSGHDLLDQETLTLIQRAQPLPKPPAEVPGDRLELVVPIEFFLNGQN